MKHEAGNMMINPTVFHAIEANAKAIEAMSKQ